MSKHIDNLIQCKDWKDYERYMQDHGFTYDHSSGGHIFYRPPNGGRCIPIPGHGKEPSTDLAHRFRKEILAAMATLMIVLGIVIYCNLC
jgi:predicted RNA binding protein YcfA (HicA-like mRNA interferase family)